jgi:hypothetical protein
MPDLGKPIVRPSGELGSQMSCPPMAMTLLSRVGIVEGQAQVTMHASLCMSDGANGVSCLYYLSQRQQLTRGARKAMWML